MLYVKFSFTSIDKSYEWLLLLYLRSLLLLTGASTDLLWLKQTWWMSLEKKGKWTRTLVIFTSRTIQYVIFKFWYVWGLVSASRLFCFSTYGACALCVSSVQRPDSSWASWRSISTYRCAGGRSSEFPLFASQKQTKHLQNPQVHLSTQSFWSLLWWYIS